MTVPAIAYYRVSTAKQGVSGLGLDAQRHAVESLCRAKGWSLIAPPFTEVESGKRNDRPELTKALVRAKQTGAKLVIAKLDRLSRNAAFLLTLQESGVDFVAADMPEADRTMVGVMALLAQRERDLISARTKEALAAVKARGRTLGNPNGAAAIRRAGKGNTAAVASVVGKATAHAETLRPVIDQLRTDGISSLPKLAAALNEQGMLTPRGGRWHASSVRNLIARL